MFVYCYELINGIGAASPLDAFCELRRFWGAYRQEEPLLDRYAVRWLWDLAAYHDLDRALVAGDPDLSQDILYDEALAKVLGRGEASEGELFSSLDALSLLPCAQEPLLQGASRGLAGGDPCRARPP